MTPPAPATDAPPANAPSVEEQFFAPAVFRVAVDAGPRPGAAGYGSEADFPVPRPERRPQPPRPGVRSTGAGVGAGTGKWIALAAMVFFVVAAIIVAAVAIRPTVAAKQAVPTVLAPRPPTAGLPTDLGVVVRVEAESARRTALQSIVETGSSDLGVVAAAQPDYHWVPGDQPSPDPHTVSAALSPGRATIAVAATNHDICAFGRWSRDTAAVYVTMAHEPSCAAVDAPATGWSSEPGGAASDLPDEPG